MAQKAILLHTLGFQVGLRICFLKFTVSSLGCRVGVLESSVHALNRAPLGLLVWGLRVWGKS